MKIIRNQAGGSFLLKIINILGPLFYTGFVLFVAGCGQQSINHTRDIQFSHEKTGDVKVMTFNIRTGNAWWLDGWTQNNWNRRKNRVTETMADNAADIIGMQEAVFSQVDEIQEALPQYSCYATGRNDGKSKGETCAIFYRNDRFELIDSGTFWFSDDPAKPGSKNWGNLFARICSWIQIVNKSDNTCFYVYNVHLDNLSQKSREKSVRLLAEKIANRKTGDPFILTGDFNMEINNKAMKYLEQVGTLKSGAAMVNAWRFDFSSTKKTGTYHNFTGSKICPKIDHISVCKSAEVLDIITDRRQLNGKYPSDHFPVIATIRLQPIQVISMNW
jgi:endonuclease/exonuclease/phosphatase family metal-dependent hydrolase